MRKQICMLSVPKDYMLYFKGRHKNENYLIVYSFFNVVPNLYNFFFFCQMVWLIAYF